MAGCRARSTTNTADSVSLSDGAKTLDKLKELAASDPEKFNEVTAKVADQLREAAASATGEEADALNQMADSFEKMSEAGTVEARMPEGGPQGPPPPDGPPPGPPPADDSSTTNHQAARAWNEASKEAHTSATDSAMKTAQQLLSAALA